MSESKSDLPTLFAYWRSSASWRVRWAFAVKGIEYRYHPVNILTGEHQLAEHRARNPLGRLPVMQFADGTLVAESVAMFEWAEETGEKSKPSLYPGSALARAQIRQLCEVINSGTAPLQTPAVQKKHSDDPGERLAWAQYFTREGLRLYDGLSASTRGLYSVGDILSAADMFLVPQVYNALRFEIAVASEFPALWKVYERCRALPSCVAASPETQVDATPV